MLLSSVLFGAKITEERWQKGETFSDYLTSRGISTALLNNISDTDLQFLSDIAGDQLFYELRDSSGVLEQALIPIGKEMQIRVVKERGSDDYRFEIIPIEYKEKEYSATVTIEQNLYTDITKALHHPALADKMGQLFKGAVNAKRFKKGDKVSFLYTQRTRMGIPYDYPFVQIALYQSRGKKQFIYADEDGYGYIRDKKKQAYTRRIPIGSDSSRFGMPLRHVRITSHFSHRRYHPILKRYRPHHGTDFGARRGTPLLAVNAGRVSFSGRMGGYGKVVKIKHPGGYESLYAHQSRIRVKRGQKVEKGQIIGYVGSTGRSTGPHLHFGLTRYGKWVNPMRVLRKKSIIDTKLAKSKGVVIKNAKEKEAKLLSYLEEEGALFNWEDYTQTSMKVNDEPSHQTL